MGAGLRETPLYGQDENHVKSQGIEKPGAKKDRFHPFDAVV